MSGGYFDYAQCDILEIIQDLEQVIEDSGHSAKEYCEFKRALRTLKKAYIYAQRIDWLLSGDDDEDSFHRRLKEELKALEAEQE